MTPTLETLGFATKVIVMVFVFNATCCFIPWFLGLEWLTIIFGDIGDSVTHQIPVALLAANLKCPVPAAGPLHGVLWSITLFSTLVTFIALSLSRHHSGNIGSFFLSTISRTTQMSGDGGLVVLTTVVPNKTYGSSHLQLEKVWKEWRWGLSVASALGNISTSSPPLSWD
jgi:hypothetical protein